MTIVLVLVFLVERLTLIQSRVAIVTFTAGVLISYEKRQSEGWQSSLVELFLSTIEFPVSGCNNLVYLLRGIFVELCRCVLP